MKKSLETLSIFISFSSNDILLKKKIALYIMYYTLYIHNVSL